LSYFDPFDDENKAVIDYFKNKTLVIADARQINRSTIKKIMSTLGFVPSNIKACEDLLKAQELMYEIRPDFMVVNLEIDEYTGLDLLEAHLKLVPDRLNAGFFIISENNSQSDAALFLQYLLDGFIPIPFSIKAFQDSILGPVKLKINPSPYKKMIEKGRGQFFQEDFSGARQAYQEARELNDRPYMAYYEEGVVSFHQEEEVEKAEELVNKSLEINDKFYMALHASFKVCELLDKNEEAYDVAVKMAELFPIHYEKFPNLIRLCIKTVNYSDILKFYEIFKTTGIDSNRVKVYISAGLIIYAKVLLKSGDKRAGVGILKKAGQLVPSKKEIIQNTVQILLEEKEYDIAEQILEYAKQNELPHIFYDILNFKILAKKEAPVKILEWGKKLLTSESRDLEIYLDLIMALKGKADFKKDLEFVITQAKKDYPLNKEEIDQAAA
jgi:tetratricopeptide (TPR) repeat protein